MSLSQQQIEALLQPLSPGRVRKLNNNSHLEAWDDRRWLLRIFGWGGFDIETLECALVSERSVWDEKNPLKGRHSVVYRVQARLVIKDAAGNEVAHFDDAATGDSQNQPSLGDAHDQAVKSAMSQALKRCCVNLGSQFGLSLYAGGSVSDVVGRSIAHDVTVTEQAHEDVRDGELVPENPPADTVDGTPQGTPAEASDTSAGAAGGPSTQSASAPLDVAEQVAHLRTRVIDEVLGESSRREAAKILARLGVEAGQAHLLNEPTTSPAGEPMTVGVLLDTAAKHIARKPTKSAEPEQVPA